MRNFWLWFKDIMLCEVMLPGWGVCVFMFLGCLETLAVQTVMRAFGGF
jgi:hypothetical protein